MTSLPPAPPLPRRPTPSLPSAATAALPPPLPPPLPARPLAPSVASSSPELFNSPAQALQASAPPLPSRPIPPPPTIVAPPAPAAAESSSAPKPPSPFAEVHLSDSDDSGSDSDSEREDAYETLASRIAEQTDGDQRSFYSVDSARTSRSARVKGLRKRLLNRLARDGAAHKKDDDASSLVGSVGAEDEGAALRAALEELEDVKVARLLDRVAHRVQEVTIAPPSSEAVAFPTRAAFTREGRTDWWSFGAAYLTTSAATYTPPALLAPPPRDRLSLSFLFDELERIYVLAPPLLAEQIVEGKLAKVWRWESPDTWKWCATYFTLWAIDLIPALPILFLLYLMLKARLFPPTPEELLAEGVEESARSREAAELSKQLKSSSKVGLVLGSAARGVKARVWDRDEDSSDERGGALARGLGGSAMLGGLAGGLHVDADAMARARRRKEQPPSAMARALMGATSTAGGVGGGSRLGTVHPPTPPVATSASSTPPVSPPSASRRSTDGDISLYRLVKELGRVAGPSAQQMLADGSDLGEKIKNVLTRPDHPSVTPILLRCVAIILVLLVTPTWIQIKAAWAYLGLEFFGLWRLRELLPQYRKALTPIWWLLLGAPTDAELATYILQKRSRQKRPLRGRKTIKRAAKARARASLDLSPDNASVLNRSSLDVNRLSFTRSRASSFTSTREPFTEPTEEPIGVFFALYRSIPGDLIITPTRIRFSSTRGLRTISLLGGRLAKKLAARRTADGIPAELSDTESVRSVAVAESGYAVDLSVDEIVGVKKESRFRFEGLLMTTRSGEVLRLANVSDRDDAFNKLLSVTPTSL